MTTGNSIEIWGIESCKLYQRLSEGIQRNNGDTVLLQWRWQFSNRQLRYKDVQGNFKASCLCKFISGWVFMSVCCSLCCCYCCHLPLPSDSRFFTQHKVKIRNLTVIHHRSVITETSSSIDWTIQVVLSLFVGQMAGRCDKLFAER